MFEALVVVVISLAVDAGQSLLGQIIHFASRYRGRAESVVVVFNIGRVYAGLALQRKLVGFQAVVVGGSRVALLGAAFDVFSVIAVFALYALVWLCLRHYLAVQDFLRVFGALFLVRGQIIPFVANVAFVSGSGNVVYYGVFSDFFVTVRNVY